MNIILASVFFAGGYALAYFTAPHVIERIVEKQPIVYNETRIINNTVVVLPERPTYVFRYNLSLPNSSLFELTLGFSVYSGDAYWIIYTDWLNIVIRLLTFEYNETGVERVWTVYNPVLRVRIDNTTGVLNASFVFTSSNVTGGAWVVHIREWIENGGLGPFGIGESTMGAWDMETKVSGSLRYGTIRSDYKPRWVYIAVSVQHVFS